MSVVFPDSKTWWEYREYDEEEREKIVKNLTTANRKIHLSRNVFDNMLSAYKFFGLSPHPIFKKQPDYKKKTNEINPELGPSLGAPEPIKEDNPEEEEEEKKSPAKKDDKKKVEQNDEEEEEERQVNFIHIGNHKIDYATLKMLLFCIEPCDIDTIKLNHNELNPSCLKALFNYVSSNQSKFRKFFFDWNTIPQSCNEFLHKFSSSSKIEFLSLRACGLNDESFTILCKGLGDFTAQSAVKFLDVSYNHIGKKGLEALTTSIKEYKMLQYFGIAQNGLSTWSDIEPLLNYIGYTQIEGDDLTRYQEVYQEIQQIEMTNSKLRAAKKTLKPSPMLDSSKTEKGQDEEGNEITNTFINSGEHFKMINLALNKLDDGCYKQIRNFIKNTHEDFCLILNYNKFTTAKKQKLRSINKIKIDMIRHESHQ